MSKIYSSEKASIFNGDIFDSIEKIESESVDMIFADPPYNLSNDGFTCHAGKRVSVNKGKWDASKGIEEDFNFHANWLAACNRVLKPNGTLWLSGTYHSIFSCGYAMQKQGWHIINDICWYKPNAAPNLACRMFTASHETLIWAKKSKTAKHYFDYDFIKNSEWEGDFLKKPEKQMRSVWAITGTTLFEKRFGKHPTQKPEKLLERIVLACSKPDDLILDPFCGSATTGVVSLRHGRKFIGIDSNLEYLENIAIPRLKDESCKSKFYDMVAGK